MKQLNITLRIWLSVGVFIAGLVFSTLLGQLQGVSTEHNLRNTAQALFPAAQQTQEAQTAFDQAVKAFSDSVLTQDASGLDRAVEMGQVAVNDLTSVSKINGLAPGRAGHNAALSSTISAFLGDAQGTYKAVLSGGGNLSADVQTKMGDLAHRTDDIKAQLKSVRDQSSQDLKDQLGSAQASSFHQRLLALAVFAITILVAGLIVSITIRRSITRPIENVVRGVQLAISTAAEASDEMASAGGKVAKDAQEQAACLEETSASLDEISATTRENAKRASDADRLMREATDTATKATGAMDQLTRSMGAISKSSKEVSDVLRSINEIAFHTNILALNAAVEAARAGEAGAGFSVVADEVRALAQRAAQAANSSGETIERTIGDVHAGVNFVTQAHDAFKAVTTKIADGAVVVGQIAVSSEEQARGVAQIGKVITRISSVTQNNVAHARNTADAAAKVIEQVQTTREHLGELVIMVGIHEE